MAAEGLEGLTRSDFASSNRFGALAAVGGGLFAGICFTEAIHKAGAMGALAPAVAIFGLILLRYPGTVLAVLLTGAVLIEPSDPGLLPKSNFLYAVIGHVFTPIDLLLFAALAGLLIRFAIESKRPLGPAPMTAPLALLALATVAGVVTSLAANAAVPGGELYHRTMNDLYVIAIPILIVNTVRTTAALRACLVAAAALAAIKGVSGAYAAIGGSGVAIEEETVSYLDPTANMVMMVFLFGVAAAAIRRVRMPGWVIAAAPIVLLALFLSYRRSFWIATIVGLVAVAIIASRYRGRTALVLAAVAVAVGFASTGLVQQTGGGPSQGPLAERVQTLNPIGEDTKRGDQYRNDERRSVIATLEEHPLTGVGLGQQWKVHYPLAESHPRNYVHFALLWFWLELGPFGVLAYVAVLGMAIWMALRVFRDHPDPLVKVGAIAGFAGLIGLIVVELTATFTGVDPRFSILLGAIIGWLVAAWRGTDAADRTRGFLAALGT